VSSGAAKLMDFPVMSLTFLAAVSGLRRRTPGTAKCARLRAEGNGAAFCCHAVDYAANAFLALRLQ
jgi:hypothetical protein